MKIEDWLEKWNAWASRNDQRNLTRETGNFDRLGLLLMVILIHVGGTIFIGWSIWKQVWLEKGFHDRYGENWRVEYEKYYGPLMHSHVKLAVCVVSLLSILVIAGWFFYSQRHKKRRRHRHP